MDIVLIAGLWLPVSIWDEVAEELRSLGNRPLPAALPGVDDEAIDATLDDQLAAVLAVVDGADRPTVVGHSAACTLAWMVADRRPDSIDRVVLLGGFAGSDGAAYADFFPCVDGVMPFPGWEPFEGADSADLDESTREDMAARAIPVLEGVAKGMVELGDERRLDVPVVLICPEYSPEQAKAWIDGGDVPELGNATNLTYVNIDSGHWPMVSRPSELAQVLAGLAV